MVSPDSWDSSNRKRGVGRENGFPRLLVFKQWEGDVGEGERNPQASVIPRLGGGGGVVFLAFWDSNSGKVQRGRGEVSPGFWDYNCGKMRRGKGTGIPRLLGLPGNTIFLVFHQ